ncbi:hypothetical protein [Flavobacterium yafengii]|uniref:hypothetical protein n=1 Tax=Flavobacterium yafengii TaxID=3041253 RepID=UPI0024A80767|nr:hypothetical protein [Flavobacterium yafengii]MDI5886540.1 hypothetical protein [Flavobacterium yafengii]
MIDFLKLLTFDATLIDYFNSHSLLEWVSNEDRFNHFDNEVINTKTKKQYKGIYFCFYSNKLEILFKPHYYFNGNLHNANDFTVIDSINIIKEFKSVFNINLMNLKVVNIEYGLNVISSIDIKDLITYLAYHEKNEFRTDVGLPYSKKSYRINKNGRANQYKIIKAYAKGLQFPKFSDINTFRFEVKSKESKYIKELRVQTLNDLLNKDVYVLMADNIIKEFEKVLILDNHTDIKILSIEDQLKLNDYLNPHAWYKFINQSRNVFSKNKTRYNNLIDKTGDHLKKQLERIIIEKLEVLKRGAISTPRENINMGANSTVYIDGNCTLNEIKKTNNLSSVKNSICPVSGLSLCNEKEGAKYALTTTLKKLKETAPETFELVKINLLKKSRGKPKFEQSEISHLAKQIRNEYYNPFKIKRQGYKKPLNYFQHSQLNILITLGI